MAATVTKQLLIHSIDLVEIDGSSNIPTAIVYKREGLPLVGYAARAIQPSTSVNEDFKIELGHTQPGGARSKRQFLTATGERKAAAELAADFLHQALKGLGTWLQDRDIAPASTVVVAEPLQLQSDEAPPEWLSNYRNNLRRIFLGQGFSEVQFLPEPFAVFQYYRYGIRVQPVAERSKHIALVVDFGGGTTDVCVIETTKDGDVSESGTNSKPLGAASIPHGGYALNRLIAQALLKRAHYGLAGKISQAVGLYKQWKKGQVSLDTLSDDYRNFIGNYHALVHEVEGPKIAICRSITSWQLDATDDVVVPVRIPEFPFKADSPWIEARLSSTDLKRSFVEDMWRPYLRPLIQTCLQRATAELRGQTVSICLLSGGSANVGWLRPLLEQELFVSLGVAVTTIPIPDYQEVVAKGLAVECARRFYSEGGDFSAPMTYNRLCLLLNPDDSGTALKAFTPTVVDLPGSDGVPGVLLPSASVIRRFIDQPMVWKVRLDKAPRLKLQYHFLRSSFDPNDTPNLQNVEETVLATPKDTHFESNVRVSLRVKEDGTAYPEFIYRTGNSASPATSVTGKPFYLDMTYGSSTPAKAYVGFDFGTSNSSISFVDERRVQTYQTRVAQRGWQTLGELVDTLPEPLATLLARLQAEVDPLRYRKAAFEFIEGALTLFAYTLFVEYCISTRSHAKLWKGFGKRSAGPLWGLTKGVLEQFREDGVLAKQMRLLLTPENTNLIDQAINSLNEFKHDKASVQSDPRPVVDLLADVAHRAFREYKFGFFENVQKARFQPGFRGLYREATGRAPFYRLYSYDGEHAFSDTEAFLLNVSDATAVPLAPFCFWDRCSGHPDASWGHFFVFDSMDKDGFSFKALGYPCSIRVALDGDYDAIARRLGPFLTEDQRLQSLQAGVLRERTT